MFSEHSGETTNMRTKLFYKERMFSEHSGETTNMDKDEFIQS
jgi:hypothetical protein